MNIGKVSTTQAILGNATVAGTLGVTGNTTVTGTLGAGATTVSALTSPSVDTTGTLTIGASSTGMNIGKVSTRQAILGNATVAGTLGVTGTLNGANITLTSNNCALSSTKNFGSGDGNTGFGAFSVHALTTATFNTGIGYSALLSATTGGWNSALGSGALKLVTTGTENTAIGINSLSNCLGNYNTAIGSHANSYNSNSGSNYNTTIGYQAHTASAGNLLTTTLVSNSTALGASSNCNGFSNSTAIGYNATCTAINQIMLGTSAETVNIPGRLTSVGLLTATNASLTNVSSSVGTFSTSIYSAGFYSTSDYKLKENIKYITNEYDIQNLKPCSFNFINSSTKKIGFIAQDVEKIIPEAVTSVGDTMNIDYSALVSVCVDSMKQLIKKIEVLEKRIEVLESK